MSIEDVYKFFNELSFFIEDDAKFDSILKNCWGPQDCSYNNNGSTTIDPYSYNSYNINEGKIRSGGY